ncbi:MAG: Acetolactate synthase small subunit, partial [uncultured Actinomycetospora sp.]
DDAHAVGPRRGQARRPGPHRRPVLPPRLQHRVARRGPHRGGGDLAHDDLRDRRRVPPRAGHEAAQQAGARHQDRRAGADLVGAARARDDEGARRRDRALAGPRGHPDVPRQGRGRLARGGHGGGHGHRGRARRAAPDARALRRPRGRAVGDGGAGPRAALHRRAPPL